MGNYIYKKGTVQPLTIDIPDVTADVTPDVSEVEQVTTASESLKEQIKRIEENNYISPTVTVTHIPISPKITTINQNKRFDFENKGRPNQLLSNFSNDISAALQSQNDNKVCAKTPKNSPRLHDTTSTEEYKNDASDSSDNEEDIPGESACNQKDVKNVTDRTSCGICDSWVVKKDITKQEEEDAFREFYKMMRDIML